MRTVRPAIATDPGRFGRGIQRDLSVAESSSGLNDDFKLFATTFLGGFIFVSILLA